MFPVCYHNVWCLSEMATLQIYWGGKKKKKKKKKKKVILTNISLCVSVYKSR
jgi:hypothetical protein